MTAIFFLSRTEVVTVSDSHRQTNLHPSLQLLYLTPFTPDMATTKQVDTS